MGSREVADLLGMSREQVWRLWNTGRLAGYRFDRLLRFAPKDVASFMDEHYRPGTATTRGVGAGEAPAYRRGRARPGGESVYRRI